MKNPYVSAFATMFTDPTFVIFPDFYDWNLENRCPRGPPSRIKFRLALSTIFERLLPDSKSTSLLGHFSADPLYPPPEAAAYIGVTEGTLSVWRCTKRYDIPYIKVGRLVKYRKSALDAWLLSRTH